MAQIIDWLLIPKFRFKLKKVGETTRPFRCDLNQIPYDFTVKVKVGQLRSTVCDPIDYTVHWIILEWVAFPFSRVSSQHRERIQGPRKARGFFPSWAISDYTLEVTNRFKDLDLIDRLPEELWRELSNIVQMQWPKPSQRKRNASRQSGCLRKIYN